MFDMVRDSNRIILTDLTNIFHIDDEPAN